MTLDDILDLAAAILLVLGGVLSLAAGVGLLRFPDALGRLHAATKPQVLGLALVILAIALDSRNWSTILALAPVLVLQMLTAPISAHMVGRAAYRTGDYRADLLVEDDLAAAVEEASREEGP